MTVASFSAHNIRFADGSETLPGYAGGLVADTHWCRGAKRLLQLLYRGDFKGRRIIDLGCLEGGYTLEFARMGFDALGLEVRRSNFENCLEVKRRAALANLDFVNDDAWNLAKYGRFDVIFCCGLLYHLDRPGEFIHLMGRQATDAIIINTHFAPHDWYPMTAFKDVMGPLEKHEGVPGRWYREHGGGTTEQLEAMKWASWTNRRSFWPTKEALLQLIQDAGFDVVLEQYDIVGDIHDTLMDPENIKHHRGVYIGLRSKNWGQTPFP